MNFTTIFKTFTQQQKDFCPTFISRLQPVYANILFAFSASACQFVCFSYAVCGCCLCVECACVCLCVKGCHSVHDINFIYTAYADVVDSAALFMLVSPFYVYLNFLLGPHQKQMKETAAQGGAEKCWKQNRAANKKIYTTYI